MHRHRPGVCRLAFAEEFDDLATLLHRTAGGQKAPVVIRTKGQRLQGIWHTGSPMSAILNLTRGIYLVTPRNMVQAAGFYNTLFRGDAPAILIEVLNGYRLKERVPENLADFRLPLGVPETIDKPIPAGGAAYPQRIIQEEGVSVG